MGTATFTPGLEQRMEALHRANAVRSRRAEFKRDLKAHAGRSAHGRPVSDPVSDVVALLVEPPEWLETMKLFDLLLATPKYGRVKVNRILAQARVSPSKTVGGLSDRQRREIAGMLLRGRR